MKRKILIFFLILLFLVFMAGIAAAIFAGPVSTRFGPKGIAAAVGMGLVSLGAGTGLLRSPKKG